MTPKSREELHDILLALQEGDLGFNGAINNIFGWHQQQLEQAVREARRGEWNLIHETLHSALIEAELHIGKVMDGRIAELQSTREDKSNE